MKETLQTKLNGVLENHVINPENIGISWQTFSEKVYTASLDAIDTASRHHQDWFDNQNTDIKLLLEKKHNLHRSHQNDPTSTPKRDAKQECQKGQWRMQNEWFDRKGKDIEIHSAGCNSKMFYSSLKVVYGRQADAGSPPHLLDVLDTNLITTDKKNIQVLRRAAEETAPYTVYS